MLRSAQLAKIKTLFIILQPLAIRLHLSVVALIHAQANIAHHMGVELVRIALMIGKYAQTKSASTDVQL